MNVLILHVRFLAGRYHATAWDHHVNEGTIEWPPSPWRILRALVAASHRLSEPPSDAALTALLEPLADSLPSYRVPPYGEGHVRHYMPLDNKGLPGDKSALIFDAFVAPGSGADAADGELDVVWADVSLDEPSLGLLDTLCAQLGYLGRAESWVEITPEYREEGEAPRVNCAPATEAPEPGQRSLRLMGLARRAEHIAWREQYVETLPKKKRGAVPESVLDVLRQDTGSLRSEGWSSVPGTRWVSYALTEPRAVKPTGSRRPRPRPSVALYRLAGSVLPSVTKTLQVGERMHQALVAWSDDGAGPNPAFAAHDVGAADHAAVCPLDVDGDGKLDHLLVYMSSGFDRGAEKALGRGRRLHGVGRLSLTLTLLGTWTDSELDQIPVPQLPPTVRESRVWRSSTPFLLVRHPKRKRSGEPRLDSNGDWIDGPESQLELELTRRGFPEPESITPCKDLEVGGRRIAWYRFQRERHHGGGARGGDRGYGFELRFAEPVRGPILVGYGRFFGLGQFVPV